MRQNAHTIWSSDPVQRQHFERACSSVSQQTVMRLIFTIRQTAFYLVLKERNPYDVHVYYKNTNEEKAAMDLRQKMQHKFGTKKEFQG